MTAGTSSTLSALTLSVTMHFAEDFCNLCMMSLCVNSVVPGMRIVPSKMNSSVKKMFTVKKIKMWL